MAESKNARYYLRSCRYLLARYVLARRTLVARADLCDMQLRFRIEDGIGRHLYKRGVHEAALSHTLVEQVAPQWPAGGVAIDIGANLGWYAILLERALSSPPRVFAFEPDPENFALLEGNIRLNGASRVEAVRKALSDRAGRQTMYPYTGKNRGRHSLLKIHASEGEEVETMRLDDFLAERGIEPAAVRFVKIDVEGYEPVVFRGMRRVLETDPWILGEFSPDYMRRGGLDPAEYVDTLTGHGFLPYCIAAGQLARTDRQAILAGTGNCDLWWKKDPR